MQVTSVVSRSLLILVLVTGCASNSGVVPVGKDTYMVSRQAATGFVGMASLRAKALREGSQYCVNHHKFLQLQSIHEPNPPYILTNFPRTEITFLCVDENDPRYTDVKLRSDNGVNTIETR
jgi:hypothetical protein